MMNSFVPGCIYRIRYSGDEQCLPNAPKLSTAEDLELLFQLAAETAGGTASIFKRGGYDGERNTSPAPEDVEPHAESEIGKFVSQQLRTRF